MSDTPTIRLADVIEELRAPFPLALVALKPGAVTQDRTRALALAYVDSRAYQRRLDDVVGPDNWELTLRPTPFGLIARLVVLGVVREEVGDFPADPDDPNRSTTAAAQAFKRCCATFGLGRYLYDLPQIWAPYDNDRKTFRDRATVIRQIYSQAGLLPQESRTAAPTRPPTAPHPAPTTRSPTPPARVSTSSTRLTR